MNIQEASASSESEQNRKWLFESLLHEYDSLRSEIVATQGHRFQIVAFALAAIGVIISFGGKTLADLLKAYSQQGQTEVTAEYLQFFALGICLTLYAVIIPSILMVRSAQRNIATIGCYIRNEIEPLSAGLNWETRLNKLNTSLNSRSGMRGMGFIFIFLTFIPLLFALYVSLSTRSWSLILIDICCRTFTAMGECGYAYPML